MVNIPEISSEFLKIFFSCDGGVSIWISNNKFHKEVSLGCGHPLLLQQIKILTEKVLNIPVKEKKNGIRLSKTESIRRFKEKIGFVKGCKVHRGKFKGLEKKLCFILCY